MSKGLEALDYITNDDYVYNEEDYLYSKDIIEKELQALEIIKKKQVNLRYFSVGDLVLYNSLEHTIELTKDEFTLLKEVLGNE